jgi:WD40 repeat protein
VWDAQSGYCVKTAGQEDWVRVVVASNDGGWLACGGNAHAVQLWAVGSSVAGGWGGAVALAHHTHTVQALAFSPGPVEIGPEASGSDAAGAQALLLASAGRDETVCVWHVARGCLLFALEGHTNWINDLLWHLDGR